MALRFREEDPSSDQRWDRFVIDHPLGSLYHHSLWCRVISSVYGHRPLYVGLEAVETGELEGALPFFLLKSPFTGKRLVSLPLTCHCDPLLESEHFEDAVDAAIKSAGRVDYTELKLLTPVRIGGERFTENRDFVTHVLDLRRELSEIHGTLHNTSVRQMIKKAKKSDLAFRMAENERDLRSFYRLEVTIRKKHGLPPQPYKFFLQMWQRLKPAGMLDVPLVEYKGKVVAAATVPKLKGLYYLEYMASDSAFHQLGANQLMLWELITHACSQNAISLDFGRSAVSNRSLTKFKERWGAEARPLTYFRTPKAVPTQIDEEGSAAKRFLVAMNRHLPDMVLRLEGRLLYPHTG